MGDTGSLTIGGVIAVIAIAVRKEWLIPVLCRYISLAENMSVIMQVSWFKYTTEKIRGRYVAFLKCHHYIIIIKNLDITKVKL